MRSLEDALKAVNDRETFLDFVKCLVEDRTAEVALEKTDPSSPFGPGAMGWENGSIEMFLEAATAWAEDTGDFSTSPSWRSFAQFLYAGKGYE